MRFLKTRLFAVIIALFLVLPAAGFAAENDELLARLASLLQQVQALQAQISAVEGGAAPGPFTGSYAPIGTATVTGTGASGACITLTANLRRGETGSEVTRLQEFLAKDRNVYPEAVVSGYYGELTERAVQRWQSLNGVVTEGTPESTGYGVVGPKTRVALQTRCSVQPNYNDAIARELIVTPIAGAVPLEVTATFSLNGSSCSSYQLDWGDGTAPIQFDARLTVEAGTVLACTKDIAHKRATHVYTRAGTHQITLRAVQGPLAEARVVKRISVSVGTTVASNFSIYPTSGPAPLTTAITFPVYGSNCTSYEADWGDGGMDRFQPSAFTLCNTETGTESLLHTYLRPGLYTVRFKTGNKPLAQLPLMEQWNVVASEGAVAGAAVAVTPTSGSAPLTVRVAMGGRGEACTSYQLDWGDGTSLQRYEAPQTTDCGSDVFEKTFAHTYVRTGTYTIRTKVGPAPLAELPTNEDTIVVRAPAPTPTPVPEPEPEPENTCPYPAGEVCGEVVSQCPFGYTCAQDLRTYADRCKMEDAGAVFYSTGACQ